MDYRRKSIFVPGLNHDGQPSPIASVVDNVLVSGEINGLDPGTGNVPEDFENQCRILFENVNRVLKAAGGSMDDIVRVTFFVKKDRSGSDIINQEWNRYFPKVSSRPVRRTVISDLPSQIQVQCEVYAVLYEGSLEPQFQH